MTYLIIIAVVLAVVLIGLYNGLVTKRNQVDNAMACIDVQLRQRYDLIPMLVETVKGYAAHEKDVLSRLVALRNVPYEAMDNAQKAQLDATVAQAAEGLRVAVESYPDLKASANFLHLQRAMAETEEQLAAARRSLNAAVMAYNTAVQSFPGNLVANAFGFRERAAFAVADEERKKVDVNL